MIPGAAFAPSQKIRFVPQIFPDQNSAVETYVTIGVVNPYAKTRKRRFSFWSIARRILMTAVILSMKT